MSQRGSSRAPIAADDLQWSPTLVRGEMKYWLLRPTERLREELKCYFIVDAEARQTIKQELHLPDGYAELVFVFGGSFDRSAIEGMQHMRRMTRSYVIGARSHSVLTRDVGSLRVIGVKLEPRMLRHLIGTPLSKLRDSTIDVRDLNDKGLIDLEDQVAQCGSASEVCNALNRFFLLRQQSIRAGDPLIDHLLKRIRAERGAISVTQCAREYRVDDRTLERKFAAWVGMSPKAYARIVRFKHAYHALVSQDRCTVATRRGERHRPASRCDDHLEGYYDQSHFYKEFRFFTGSSPMSLGSARTPSSTDVTNHLLSADLSIA